MDRKGTPAFFAALVLFVPSAFANIVFPAISHQFTISAVVPSYYSILTALAILLVETIFIQKLLSSSQRKAFLVAFLLNFISSFAGFLAVIFMPGTSGRYILGYSNMRLGTYLGLIPGYFITVVIEALVLRFFISARPVTSKRVWGTAAVMNLWSYGILLAAIVLSDIMTNGQCFKTY